MNKGLRDNGNSYSTTKSQKKMRYMPPFMKVAKQPSFDWLLVSSVIGHTK